MRFDCEIDTRRDNCPVPVIKAHMALKGQPEGHVVRILASGSSTRNFEAFARSAHYAVLHREARAANEIELLIEKTPHV